MNTKRFYTTVIFALLMSCFTVSAQSDRQKELEAQRQQKLREIKVMNALLSTKRQTPTVPKASNFGR